MRPKHILLASAGVAVVVVAWVAFSPSGLAKLDRLRTEEHELATAVAQKKSENAHLVHDIKLLQGDSEASRLSLEKRAREELGYTGAGEVVLQVPLGAAPTTPPVAGANAGSGARAADAGAIPTSAEPQ
jgi:cell division protein FtsB